MPWRSSSDHSVPATPSVGKTLRTLTALKFSINAYPEARALGERSLAILEESARTRPDKNYSLSAGQYFEVKIEYVEITAKEFDEKMTAFQNNLKEMFAESSKVEKQIIENLKKLRFDQ